MDDLIRRSSIRNMYACLNPEDKVRAGQVVIDIDAVPSAEKQGEWIEEMYNATAQIWKCSECAEQIWQPPSTEYPTYNFCPNCGCRMKGADDE